MDFEKMVLEIENVENETATANGIIQENYLSKTRYSEISESMT